MAKKKKKKSRYETIMTETPFERIMRQAKERKKLSKIRKKYL